MKNLKARGKISNGNWVYGVIKSFSPCEIELPNGDVYSVNINSLCLYTGIKDHNGKEIYENDTISAVYFGDEIRGYVKWGEKVGGWVWSNYFQDLVSDFIPELVVIGNTFDNPTLLSYENRP